MSHFSFPSSFYYPDLSTAQKGIRDAWIGGLISGSLTLAVTLATLYRPEVVIKTGMNIWNLIDVGLIFGLTWGIFNKNRACAVSLLAYFILSKLIQFTSGIVNPVAIGIAICFIWAYFNGIRGTFTYHKLKRTGQ